MTALRPMSPTSAAQVTLPPAVGVPVPSPRAAAPAAGPAPRWLPAFASPVVGPSVLAVAVRGSRVWVGGDFTYGTAGLPAGTFSRVAHWDGSTWRSLGSGLDGTVRALAVAGEDVYVGGDFTAAGGVPAAGLARWDGARWHAVAGGVSLTDGGASVLALACDGTHLYVGGTFDRAGTTAVRSVAALTLATGAWSDLGGGAERAATVDQPGVGTVRALALHGSALHVGGRFDRLSSVVTHSLATLDTRTGRWTAHGAGLRDEDAKGTVNALAVDPATGALFVGGSFTSAGEVQAWNVARLDGASSGPGRCSSLGDVASHGSKYAEVHALAVVDGRLHLGGSFTSVGSLPARHWVVHDGTSWSVPVEVDNVVRTLTPCPAGVVVGGELDNAGDLRVQHLGVWTGTGWELFGQAPHSGYFSGGEVCAVLPLGEGVVAGGLFDQAGGVALGSVGRWTGAGWDRMGGGVSAAVGHGQVLALAELDGQVYAAGSFDTAGGTAARNIAVWDGARWSPLGSGVDSDVHALAVLGGRLYVGGEFALAGGRLVGGLACWDPATATWSAVGNGPLYDHTVNALAVIGDRYLVVGGWFNGMNASGEKVVEGLHGLAMFDTSWTLDPADVLSGYFVLPGVSRYGAAGWVRALQVVGGDLYVGGWFDRAGIVRAREPQSPGFSADNLVVWHFSTTGRWEAAGDPDEQVWGLAASGDDLVATGEFTTVGGTVAGRVARLDRRAGTWVPLGAGLDRGSDHVEGRALAAGPRTGLWVGGSFTRAGDVASTNLARWAAPAPAPGPSAGPGTYEESSPQLVWSGRWEPLRSPRDSGGAARSARSGPASVTLTFSGTGVRWVSRRGRNAGVNTVHLDGRLVATVDRFAPRTEHRVTVYEVTGLPPGRHVLRIEHTGRRAPAATDDTLVIDALVVT